MKRKLLALFLTLSMALSLSAAALAAGSSDTFSDVGEKSWYAGAVAYVSGKGYKLETNRREAAGKKGTAKQAVVKQPKKGTYVAKIRRARRNDSLR